MAHFSNSRIKRMPEHKAHGILEAARIKDFWYPDLIDNKDDLQSAIDTLYNSAEGNDYSVQYEEFQSVYRLSINCKVCNKSLLSLDPFQSHNSGSSHKKKRQQKVTVRDPNVSNPLKTKRLDYLKGTFPAHSLEEMIDESNSTILGSHFLYKEVIDGKDYFTCQLCQSASKNVSQIKRKSMYRHLKKALHNDIYMNIKFPSYVEPESIALFEGRIHAPIPDFSRHMTVKHERERPRKFLKTSGKSFHSIRTSEDKDIKEIKKSPSEVGKREESPELFNINPVTISCGIQVGIKKERKTSGKSLHSIRTSEDKDIKEIKKSPSEVGKREKSPELFDMNPVTISCGIQVGIKKESLEESPGEKSFIDKDLLDMVQLLKQPEAMVILNNDKTMMDLLVHVMKKCNYLLEAFFSENDIPCYDDEGCSVIKAKIAASKLWKHLNDLT